MTRARRRRGGRWIAAAALAGSWSVAAATGGPAGATTADDAPRRRPNLLFVFSDDHAAHAISAYGSKINRTPNIDRLAAEGMRFDAMFCGNSICAPSRATALTGKHTHMHGVIDNGAVFDGSQVTLPKLLQSAGYQTAIIGKWHLKTPPTGFDHYEVLVDQGPYYNPSMRTRDGVREHRGYTTEVLTDLALEWLDESRDPDRPFLLCWWHKAPHREWVPSPEYAARFADASIPEPATLFDDYSGRSPAARQQEMTLRNHMYDRDLLLSYPGNLDGRQRAALEAVFEPRNDAYRADPPQGDDLVRWRYQRYMQDYLACVQAVDDGLGRVLDWLDAEGLADDTVVVYSSDQGFYLGDHGWYDKRWMYEPSLKMPFLVRWPGVAAPGSTTKALAQNIDFAPTFLEMAGVAAPAEMQGRSLVPILRGETPADWRRSIYYHYYEYPAVHMVHPHYGVRTDRYKLIRFPRLDAWELFDLERDPDELRSVADREEYAGVRADLEQELARLQQQYGDTAPDRDRADVRAEFFGARARTPGVELLARDRIDDHRAPDRIDPTWRPLTVGARVEGGVDGAIAAMGGGSYGFSLYVVDGMPRFTVRDHDRSYTVRASTRLPARRVALVVGVLGRDERLRLLVDGEEVGSAPGRFLSWIPREGLTIGRDDGSPAGEYAAPFVFEGAMSDVRVYRDLPDAAELAAWR